MEITIQFSGQAVSVAVTVEVYEYLDRAARKDENLAHEQRRHWDMRELDEYIIAQECSRNYILTPEQIVCRKETLILLFSFPKLSSNSPSIASWEASSKPRTAC